MYETRAGEFEFIEGFSSRKRQQSHLGGVGLDAFERAPF